MVVDKQQKKRVLLSSEVELLYAKSKVNLHPTTSKRDNVPGFLTLTRGGSLHATNKDILLSFTPESQLTASELKKYEAVDLDDTWNDDTPDTKQYKVVAKPHTSVLTGYSFSIPLSLIYSIQARKPSVGFWYGSLVLNTKDGEKLPIVFFHDDESPSTVNRQKVLRQKFDTFDDDGEAYWGGKDFMTVLGKFINVEKSTIEKSVYLVNPESNDLRNFSPFVDRNKKKEPPKNALENFKLPDVNKIIANAKWRVLETVATLGARAKNQVVDIVEEHAPPPVKQLFGKPEVQLISNEFDSARVYLAKWAAQVKEEAEQAQKQFHLDDELFSRINKELGINSDKPNILTPEEVSKTSRRKEISKVEWKGFFDSAGRLSLTVDEVKNRIFHGGLEDSIRPEAWLFLLDVYPWDSSSEDRATLRKSYETAYDEYKLKWVSDEDKRLTEFWKDQKHRIEKDINRTDRQLPIFSSKKKRPSVVAPVIADNEASSDSGPETPDASEGEEVEDEEDEDDFDVSNIKNSHLFTMREILLTYNEYNVNLGYVQGMTDLLSPLYVKIRDESLTFWAFTKFMDRMERNFVRDQSGMKKQMITLNELVQFMLPDLFKHLEKCESTDLFFFFRMLLVWYKREFEWDQVMRLWEILWTDYYSGQYHLFFATAVLSDNERIIKQNLTRFDEVLKYMNDLSMKMNLNDLLIRAELLFLRFRRMIDIIDRENSSRRLTQDVYEPQGSDSNTNIIKVSPDLRELLSKKFVEQKEGERPEGVGGG